jgi:hypothetical protein
MWQNQNRADEESKNAVFENIPDKGRGLFPVVSASRPALGPTQLPIQWVRTISSPGFDANQPTPSSAEVKKE